MHALVGYCDRWSVKPGGELRFMISSEADRAFDCRFVRLICADPNPNGPGYREIEMKAPAAGRKPGRFQPAYPGSYGSVKRLGFGDLKSGMTLAATIWPTTPAKGPQGIVAIEIGGWRASLIIDEAGGAAIEVEDRAGVRSRAATSAPMLAREWYDVVATIDPRAGRIAISQAPRRRYARVQDHGTAAAALEVSMPATRAGSVLLAAAKPSNGAAPAAAHFNGKLERPCLWRGARAHDSVLAAQQGVLRRMPKAGLIAAWDFAQGISTEKAIDVGPAKAHARLVNLPTRAMTGAGWTGKSHDWKQAPAEYGAIHFHDDDVTELGWAESVTLTVPKDWPSGFYAAHIKNEVAEDMIPFFVRPADKAKRAAVAFLVPTFTYQVYGQFQRPERGQQVQPLSREWGALTATPDRSPEFGLSSYNTHSDGSGVSITTMLRPMLDTRPRQMSLVDPAPNGSGTGRICCDSYIVDWLTRLDIAHDVITDHDLHDEGAALLAPYRVVLTGQHPEYYSTGMMDAVEAYLGQGGRLMYMGGNGFYWRTALHPTLRHALEVRRTESGIRTWASEPGEYYHAFDGEYGGLWRRAGRPGHRVVGVNFSAQGRHLGFPYKFTPGILDPRAAFMRRDIEAEAVPDGVFGDTGFMGGGASGFELDTADRKHGSPPNVLIVAKGVVIHPDYGWVNEDMLVIRHPRPHEDWSCADMVFFETPSGGAVFSVGSMTYVGSLGPNGYDNVCAKLTTNVLRRFLDPTPFA